MRIGFGRAIITPPVGFSLVGYFQDRRSEGIRDELFVTTMLVDDGEKRFAAVTFDLVGVPGPLAARVRRAVGRAAGLPPEQVMVHGVHTHTGPSTGGRDKFYVEPCYLRLLPLYAAGSAAVAARGMKPALVACGSRRVPGIAFNRRYFMNDGRVVTNPWDRPGDILGHAGPVDDLLRLAAVSDRESGKPSGLIVNFALHPDTIGDNLVSADWPGFLRARLEKEYPGATVMVLNGPSGDINHINPDDPGRRGVEVPEGIADAIFRAIRRLMPALSPSAPGDLGVYHRHFNLGKMKFTPEEIAEARKILRARRLPADSLQFMISGAIARQVEQAGGKERRRVEMNGFSLGPGFLLLGLPGEVFTDIGAAIRREAPFEQVMIAQNCHTSLGYVPSRKAFDQHADNQRKKPGYGTQGLAESFGIDCSYETTPMVCRLDTDAQDRYLSAARAMLARPGEKG